MSASPDTGNLADVLRQLVALAGDDPGEEAPLREGSQREGIEGKASENEKIEAAKPMSGLSP